MGLFSEIKNILFGNSQIYVPICDEPLDKKAKEIPLEITSVPTHEVAGQIFKINEPENGEDSNWSIPDSGEILGRSEKLTKYDYDEIDFSHRKEKGLKFDVNKYAPIKTLWAKGEEWTAEKISASLTKQFKSGYSYSLVSKYVSSINRAHKEMITGNES